MTKSRWSWIISFELYSIVFNLDRFKCLSCIEQPISRFWDVLNDYKQSTLSVNWNAFSIFRQTVPTVSFYSLKVNSPIYSFNFS